LSRAFKTTSLIARFRPGTSPPPVNMPIRFFIKFSPSKNFHPIKECSSENI
jgi:hypothetical protein